MVLFSPWGKGRKPGTEDGPSQPRATGADETGADGKVAPDETPPETTAKDKAKKRRGKASQACGDG